MIEILYISKILSDIFQISNNFYKTLRNFSQIFLNSFFVYKIIL